MKQNQGWKFLQLIDGKICSDFDKSEWTVGVERKIAQPKELCKGLNCSKYINQAKSYVNGDVVALVAYGGEVIKSDEKITAERMTIIRACHFKAQALAKYDKVMAPVLAKYNKVAAQALAKYNKVTAPAWEKYDKVTAPVWAEHNKAPVLAKYGKVMAQAWTKYDKVMAPALAKYNKVAAQALAKHNKIAAQAWEKIFERSEEVADIKKGLRKLQQVGGLNDNTNRDTANRCRMG